MAWAAALRGAWAGASRWWTDDLPPLGGGQRCCFYSVLLLLAVLSDGSPLRAAMTYAQTPPVLRTPEPLVAALGLADLGSGTLLVIRDVAFVTWICAAIGFVTRPAMLLTGVLVALLHGISRGALGIDHRWYLATYALLLLCFAASDGRWSVDGWLARRLRWWPDFTGSRSPVLRSGFARKLVLLAAVHTLFSAGVAKLMEGGIAWADGVPIRNYIGSTLDAMEQLGLPRGRWPALADFVWSRPWICHVLAVATLILELGSPLLLFVPRLRAPMLLAATAFHLGIWFTMIPSYWVQIWCYTLLVDWGALRGRGSGARAAPPTAPPPAPPRAWPALVGGSLTAALVVVAFARVESWPFTHVPMYSSYLGDDRVSDVPRSDFRSREAFARVARRCAGGNCPWAAMIPTLENTRVLVRIHGETHDVTARLGVPQLQQWHTVLYRTVWDAFAHPPGSPQAAAAADRAQQLVEQARRLLAVAGVLLKQGDAVELVYTFDDGEVVLARASPGTASGSGR